jgi:cytochrome c oxidase subunit 2
MQPKFKFIPALLLACSVLIGKLAIAAEDFREGINMPIGITEISRSTYDLHMLITIICALIGVVVYGVLIWSLIKYRKSKGSKSADFHENTTIEIVWTVIPILILVSMAIPSTGVLRQVYDSSDSDLDIMITGYQWRWQYSYLDDEGEQVSFFSNLATTDEQIAGLDEKSENYLIEVDQPLVIPVDTKVRFLLTANDVIHSWWVPEFAVKKDAIPGFINESWVIAEETGTFRGQCTELCGQEHGFMPVVVEVVEKEEFEAWYSERQEQAAAVAELTNQEWTFDQLVAQGETVYRTYCSACHQLNGQGLPPAFPAMTNSAIVNGPIDGHVNIVLNGSPGTAMAAFRNQLNPVDIAAVITYERNALGNSVGDMISPIEILQAQAE